MFDLAVFFLFSLEIENDDRNAFDWIFETNQKLKIIKSRFVFECFQLKRVNGKTKTRYQGM